MTNNDILRRLRYILNYNDSKMVQLFSEAKEKITQEQYLDWLRKDDEDNYKVLIDQDFAAFLNALITDKRGKKDGPAHKPETRLSNNIIFMKLKIAFNLQAEQILKIMDSADFSISKHELSAFFRKTTHKHYRKCNDQIFRHFLKGLQLKFR